MFIVLATVPIVVAIIMLAVLRRSGLQAGLLTFSSAILVAVIPSAFHLPPVQLLIATGTGAGTSLLVLFVLFPGLLLYHLLAARGGIQVLARGVARLSPDRDLQILLLVLGLAPLIESVSGFGLGTVVVVPIIAALDTEPLQAAILGMLGQIAVPWGALAVGTALGATLSGLDANMLGAHTALLTAPLPAGCGLVVLALSGGWRAVRRLWPVALLAGAILVGGEWLFSHAPGIELAGALASAFVILFLALWGRLASLFPHQKAYSASKQLVENASEEPAHIPSRDIHLSQALSPYLILTALLLVSRLVIPLQQWLQAHALLIVPATGLRLPLLYTPGFWVLVAALLSLPVLSISLADFVAALARTWWQFLPGAVAIVSFLATAQIMSSSGMTASIATLAATLGSNYAWAAPWPGFLGGWLTGSNAGSNAMFAQLQRQASIQANLPLPWIMAAQNGAGSIATMIAPARTILAVIAAGVAKGEGVLLRTIGPFVLVAVAAIMVLLVWVIAPH